MTSSAQRSNSRGKRAVFSFGDEDEDDETLRSNLQPLTKTAVDRSAFTSPHFDPDQFLSSRRHLGLERLKVELNNHLRYLKTELFELINRDYQDFINLSTNLKGVDRTIDDLRRPLLKMGTKAEVSSGYLIALIAYEMLIYVLQQARDHFQATIDDLESQLRYRAEIREKKVRKSPEPCYKSHVFIWCFRLVSSYILIYMTLWAKSRNCWRSMRMQKIRENLQAVKCQALMRGTTMNKCLYITRR